MKRLRIHLTVHIFEQHLIHFTHFCFNVTYIQRVLSYGGGGRKRNNETIYQKRMKQFDDTHKSNT